MELDHVLIAAADLSSAARKMEERYGLASVKGGRHAGWGTANRIVPLGDAYLELIAVVDEGEAATSTFGRRVAAGIGSAPGRPLGWVVRTNRIDEVAQRLGLSVSAGSRPRHDGGTLRWRLAGVEEASAEPALPFFVEWGEGTPLPGRTPAVHPAGEVRIERVELAGDHGRVSDWLGGERLPVALAPGRSAVTAIVLAAGERQFVVDGL